MNLLDAKRARAVAGRTARWLGDGRRTYTLARQFTLAALIVLILGMAVIGAWVNQTIKRDVTSSSANAAALYLQSAIGPLVQELGDQPHLSAETIERLNLAFETPDIRARVVSMKVWRLDGTIVYSRWPEMVGKKFEVSGSLAKAAQGHVHAEFDSDAHDEDRHERAIIKPLLEIYAPIRKYRSGNIIGVAEFYVDGAELAQNLLQATIASWIVVGLVTFLMLATLAGLVSRGSRTIEKQRELLSTQIEDLRTLLAQNEKLSAQLKEANVEITEVNERTLQRIGADLHDGPTQLLAYAMLRLGRFAPVIERAGDDADREELHQMRSAISDSLREARNISTGLSLPTLDRKSLLETIKLSVQLHTERTGTHVRLNTGDLPGDVPLSLKVCAYRFTQEALTNAFRHAGGKGQRVDAYLDPNRKSCLILSVDDDGPGMSIASTDARGLGLVGLRARIESFGGKLQIASHPGDGVRLTATFELADGT